LDTFQLTYKPYGERSILVEWPAEINVNILQDILKFKNKIGNHFFESKIEVKSAYNSLLISYDAAIENINDKILRLKALYLAQEIINKPVFKLWKIPVCYDEEFGLDLEAISIQNKLSKQAIIKRHSDTLYTVYFIGFLPGFLYLGGLDKKLHVPRKSTPQLQVKKGSVAIGGDQTGIYPNESPGGWNIIGNSPINFFDPTKDDPCFAKTGDKIQFVPIDIKAYHDISILVKEDLYQLESEVIDG